MAHGCTHTTQMEFVVIVPSGGHQAIKCTSVNVPDPFSGQVIRQRPKMCDVPRKEKPQLCRPILQAHASRNVVYGKLDWIRNCECVMRYDKCDNRQVHKTVHRIAK